MSFANFIRIFTIFLSLNHCYCENFLQDLGISKENSFIHYLNNKKFTELESKVLNFVENSGCSKEKTKLLMELTLFHKPNVCVEIGTFSGHSAIPVMSVLKLLKNGKMYIIEPWSNFEATKGLDPSDPQTQWWRSVNLKKAKSKFLKTIKKWDLESICKIVETSSLKAVDKIPEIDFLHIDGNCSEEGALNDTQLYLKKVHQGGYILISSILYSDNHKPTKMKSLFPIFAECEIISEIENGNIILFKKIR